MEKSVTDISALKNEHNKETVKYMYADESPTLLSDIINPIILKLTKEDDHRDMANLGPIYSPPHP